MSFSDDDGWSPRTQLPANDSPRWSSSESTSSYASSPSTPGNNTPRPPSWIPDEEESEVDALAEKVAALETEGDSGDAANAQGAAGGAAAPAKKKGEKKKVESSAEEEKKEVV